MAKNPMDEFLVCEICGLDPNDCNCPACPVCGVRGNKECLIGHGLFKSVYYDNLEKMEIIRRYDSCIRLLISFVQAFILHHRWPRFHDSPGLGSAEEAWKYANEFNVMVYNKYMQNFAEGDEDATRPYYDRTENT